MLSFYVVIILIEYVSIKYTAWNMENEIKKLKDLIENQRKEGVVYRQTQSHVQPYNYRTIL